MPLKIAYLAGPADASQIYRQWSGEQSQTYFGTDYMKQFLQLAEDVNAECYVVTWHGERSSQRLGRFTFDNRSMRTRGGALYYLDQFWWHVRLLPALLRFRPDVLFLTGNQNFWWLLAPLRTKFLPSYHAVLWPKLLPVKQSWRTLLFLNRWLIFRRCKAVIATSHDIGAQVAELTKAQVVYHLPTWSPQQFAGIPAPVWSRPFRIIFVSRIEANKGVFDVLEMARKLGDEYQFDICGVGSALEEARRSTPSNVTFHGFCDQTKLREIMGRSHLSIVPTRKDCEAGFEMTCAEAILSGRPLITSAVCPALEYLREASIEVEPENVGQYVEAIRHLSEDREFYEGLCAACGPLQDQFFDPDNSWLSAAKKALMRLGCRWAANQST